MRKYRIIISGGGTGGHIFPAISIANTFKKRFPDAEILFVGAEDRMEIQRSLLIVLSVARRTQETA